MSLQRPCAPRACRLFSLIRSSCHACSSLFFFFNDPATTEIYTLSLHDALPIISASPIPYFPHSQTPKAMDRRDMDAVRDDRSEEHTSELQSRENLVCRLLLEKKKKKNISRPL